ncbi:ABC transporter ATP-binding protein [Catenuloplanes atrovinosus]|uniref:ABC-type multidrug transport system ATPase subunit n=1 Tax=Catenuloplanes atrovinosus TaxID=137266 RepID=A0AAE3YTE8_9ACTN|nr:ABC transporter ATP-binding protein [Catenuloplanes atrovinosus]MDR7278034.1 ABC-type multidrug transport system ATPase subunit [Catenuloplanes atrovinosus]
MAGLVELRGVGKRYGRSRTVLDDIDLVIYPGEVVGVIGGNGSGKSTLLRIVAGLSPVTSGTVVARPRAIGYVPERFPTQARVSARSYLTHIGRIRGLGTRAARARADELLSRLALVGGANAELRRLSKGNAQKVAVAQALMVPPQLLVLDEPWSGLDAAAHEVLAELIAETAREGGAVVFTDHREAVVSASASVIYRIAGGRLSTAPSGEALAFVELVDAALDAPEPDWWRLPGVLEAGREDAVVTLEIVAKYADELIFQALGNGWSVQSVRRSAPVPVVAGRGGGDDVADADERDAPDAGDGRDRRDDDSPDRDAPGDADTGGGRNPGFRDDDGALTGSDPGDREKSTRAARRWDEPEAGRGGPAPARGDRDPRDERDPHGDRDPGGDGDPHDGPDAVGGRDDDPGRDDGRSRGRPGDAWRAAGELADDEPGAPRPAPAPRKPRPNLTLVKNTDVAEEVR